ncbi:MAG: dihydrolipoamide acetyltransferase family protein [Planctomycetota bacterium]
MAKEIRLPQLGQTMEEGTIVSCRVNVGNKIKKGDVIFEIETDKATLEMESPLAGFVKSILVEVGQTVPINTPLIIVGSENEQVEQSCIDSLKSSAAAAVEPEAPAEAAVSEMPAAGPVTQADNQQGRIFSSPRAKMTAEKLGVDLAEVSGSGPSGRILEADVVAAKDTAVAPAAPEPDYKLGEKVAVTKIQKIVAERMLQSKREIPCFYLNVKADVTGLVELRAKMNRKSQTKVAFNDFIIRAMAFALRQYPVMTGRLEGSFIETASTINVGFAVAVPDGLVAPVVKDVLNKSVVEIATRTKALIEKARSGRITPTDLAGACITLSNLGAFGIESFIPIVVPGQCSILGVGGITDTCVPSQGDLLVRKIMNLTLSVDHRIANGAYAAQFLDYLRRLLEDAPALAD